MIITFENKNQTMNYFVFIAYLKSSSVPFQVFTAKKKRF